jgi:GNAT superfamily N-acetyltransferase
MIARMEREHAADVAGIHQSVLPESIYSVLGHHFLEYYYRHLLNNDGFFGYVDIFDGKVTGFAAATPHSMSIFWRQLLMDGWRISGVLAKTLIERPRTLAAIARAVVFLLTERRVMLPDVQGELLSFAVLPAYRGRSVASDGSIQPTPFYTAHRISVAADLFQATIRELARRGTAELKIMTAASNSASNRFYARMGCRLVPDRFTAFGQPTHLYRANVAALVRQWDSTPAVMEAVA